MSIQSPPRGPNTLRLTETHRDIMTRYDAENNTAKQVKWHLLGLHETRLYFPMQNVEKIRLRMSSEVVWPVRESRAQRAR